MYIFFFYNLIVILPFVAQEPLYMMLSIVYLIFGLALTSMCINVVQVIKEFIFSRIFVSDYTNFYI